MQTAFCETCPHLKLIPGPNTKVLNFYKQHSVFFVFIAKQSPEEQWQFKTTFKVNGALFHNLSLLYTYLYVIFFLFNSIWRIHAEIFILSSSILTSEMEIMQVNKFNLCLVLLVKKGQFNWKCIIKNIKIVK